MSLMLPQSTIDVLRKFVDISVNIYGIDVTLYVPNNWESVEVLDAYQTTTDLTYTTYNEVKAFINWSPNAYRLRNLGLFTEGELPILVHFPQLPVDIIRGSYIKVPMQSIPNSTWTNDEFEVVDLATGPMHDSQVVNQFKLVPRRTKVT